MLQVDDIHTYYGKSWVLQGVSLHVPEGRVVAVLGRNGMGKTTLIRSIMGLTPPRSGEIRLRGQPIHRLPPYRISRLGIGLVPQGRRVFPSLRVREHLETAARSRPRADGAEPWNEERVLHMFPQLTQRLDHTAGKLSGGEQQMLAVARALMGNPDLLLLDEPTEGLAPLRVRELGELLGQLKRDGLSMLLVEQNVSFALELADDVYIMGKGHIAFQCPPQVLRDDPELRQRYLGVSSGARRGGGPGTGP